MSIVYSKNKIPIRLTDELNSVIPYFIKHKNVWTKFDNEADVLYMNFSEKDVADYSEMTDDDLIIRYNKEDKIIGVTVLNVSKRK